MYATTARILDHVEKQKERKLEIAERRRRLWDAFLAGMPKILDEQPQNFPAYCERFKAAYESIGK